MPHKVVFRPAAERDLTGLYNCIAERAGMGVAGRHIGRLEAACMALSDFPERGRARDELLKGLG